MEIKNEYTIHEDIFETSKNLIEDIENIIKETKKNNNNNSSSSGGFYDEEKDWFFDKNYYLVPLKNLNKQLKYNDKREYYSDENEGLDKLIKSFRNKTPTKIIVGAMLKGQESSRANKIMQHNIIVKQKEKKQELYIDVALMSPEYMNNIKEVLERVMNTMRQEIEIHKNKALQKHKEIMEKQQQIAIQKQLAKTAIEEKTRMVKEKLEIASNTAKRKYDSVLQTVKKFLYLFAKKPTKIVDDFVGKMNKDFKIPVSLSFDKDINFDAKIAECSGQLIQNGLKFMNENNMSKEIS